MPTLTGKFRARFDCFAMWTAILTISRRQTTATGMGTPVFILFVHELALSYADFLASHLDLIQHLLCAVSGLFSVVRVLNASRQLEPHSSPLNRTCLKRISALMGRPEELQHVLYRTVGQRCVRIQRFCDSQPSRSYPRTVRPSLSRIPRNWSESSLNFRLPFTSIPRKS